MQRQDEGIKPSNTATTDQHQSDNNKLVLDNIVDCLKTIDWIPRQLGSWQVKQTVIDNNQGTNSAEFAIYFVARGADVRQAEQLLDNQLKNAIKIYCNKLLAVQDVTALNLDLSCCDHLLHADKPVITRQPPAQSTSHNSQGMFNGRIHYKLTITPALQHVLELVSLLKKINSYNHYPLVSNKPELAVNHQIVINSIYCLSPDLYFPDINTLCFKDKPLEQCTAAELKLALEVLDICIYHSIKLNDQEIMHFKNLGLYGVIDFFRTLLNHKHPQNRARGDYNALIESDNLETDDGELPETAEIQQGIYEGNVYFYKIDAEGNKKPCCEPVGLLSLTSSATHASPKPTREMIRAYVLNELMKFYNNIKSKHNALLENIIKENCTKIATYFHNHGGDYLPTALVCNPSEVIKYFINDKTQSIILNYLDSEGNNALHLAVNNRDLKKVKFLVDLGVNIDHANHQRMTPFYNAAYLGDVDIVAFFLEKGVDINQHGGAAIFYATHAGSRSLVKFLLDKGVALTNTPSKKALLFAAADGYLDIVTMLIEKAKVDINYMTDNLKTALFQAAKTNQLEIAKYLIQKGADVNIENGCILRCAILFNHPAMVKLLLSKGADLKLNDPNDSILQLAINRRDQDEDEDEIENRFEIILLLLKSGVDINKVFNGTGGTTTVLHIAIERNDLLMVKFLLNYGPDLSIKSGKYQQSALHLAVAQNNLAIVKKLVKHGANLNAHDKYNTVLITAVNNHGGEHHSGTNFIPIIEFLLANGADVNAVDISANKQSALHNAVFQNHFTLVKLLVKYGADINLTDAHGDSPLSLAQSRYTTPEITYYLLELASERSKPQQKSGSH